MASNSYSLKNKVNIFVLLVGVLGLLLVYILSSKSDFDKAEYNMRSTIRYVNSQYMEYQKLSYASVVKSMTKAASKVEQLSRNLLLDKKKDELPLDKLLERYADEQRLNGIMLLNDDGSLIMEYNNDRFGYAALKNNLTKASVLDIAKYKNKVYTNRVETKDGAHIDIGVCARMDAPGLIASYYHTAAAYAQNYNMSLQTLFSGYSMQNSGTIVITNGDKIITSNDAGLVGSSADSNAVLGELKKIGVADTLKEIKAADGKTYYGSVGRGRDYYIYIYYSNEQVFKNRWNNMLYALIIYMIAVGLFFAYRAQSEKMYLLRQSERDEEYKEQLREAARVAEHANHAKTEFLQRMSHDIRTPINGIRGLIEIGDYYATDLKKQEECRRKIWKTSGFLLELINDVLDMGKLSSGEVKLEKVSFDAHELCQEVIDIVSQQAKQKNVELVIKSNELPYGYLIGSPLHVKRIFLNILGNAIKYNKPNGKIYVSLNESLNENNEAVLEFICEDTGIGISKRFLPHVFEAFAQDRDIARSNYEGSGLGMPIVKSLVDKMGGTIKVESEKGVGTIFTTTIPFALDTEPHASEEEQQSSADASVKGLHLLVAEDNELNMEIVRFFLDNAGITYKAVNNGKEALEAFASSQPYEYDMVLMDVMMPFMDGMEATRRIRALQREDAAQVPIIAMTANAFVEDKQQALAAGMTEHITKPLKSERLLKTLAKYVKQK